MKRIISAGLAVLFFSAAIYFHAEAAAAVMDAGIRCVTILIPSLYLCAVLAAFFVRSGILDCIARPLHRCTRNILHMDGNFFVIFLFSQIAGYPAGAQLLQQMHQKHPAYRIETFLPVCFGCGPAFLTGTVCAAAGLLPDAAGILFLAIFLPNLLFALVLARRTNLRQRESLQPTLSLRAQTFTDSVDSGASAMLKICSMVLIFAAFIGVMEGVLETFPDGKELPDIAACVLEISNITEYLRNGGSLPMAAALLSFGGICVHLQNAAIFGMHFPWRIFWCVRLMAAVCTYGICWLGLEVLYHGDVQAAFLPTNSCRPEMTAGSIVPSVCLIVMSFFLLRMQEQQNG